MFCTRVHAKKLVPLFTIIFVDIETKTNILMPRRALGTLRNLGKWAISTTKKTYLEKIKKAIPKPTAKASGKENVGQVCHLMHVNMFSYPVIYRRPEKARKHVRR